MSIWYSFCDLLCLDFLQWNFMKNAFLAIILMAPLFGLCSTMVVTGRMSFFSDALGHSAFTGIAIGAICGIGDPTWLSVVFAVFFAVLFSIVRNRGNQTADTVIGVFSSTAVALGIFIATLGGESFTKFNRYLIGDILSITPMQIGMLFFTLIVVVLFWIFCSNNLTLASIHPQLAATRGINTAFIQGLFTVLIAVVVTLSISWVGLLIINSLLVLPGAAARNVAKNMRQYHLVSILFAFVASILGLLISYYWGTSAGASISLILAPIYAVSLIVRKAGNTNG